MIFKLKVIGIISVLIKALRMWEMNSNFNSLLTVVNEISIIKYN